MATSLNRTSYLQKRPSIGELNRRVVIRKRQDFPTGNVDIEGDEQSLSSDYPVVFNRWAAIAPVGTAIYMDSAQIDNGASTITHRIKLRFTPEINTYYEVVHKEIVYRVKRVVDQLGEARFTILECEQINDE